MPESPHVCSQEAELIEAWNAAAERFSAAVSALRKSVGTITNPEYERLRAEIEDARLDADNARALLDIHRREHGC